MAKSNSPITAVLNSATKSNWVPALFFTNIFFTGFLFGSHNIVPGFSDHLWDFANGLIGAGAFYLLAAFYAKKSLIFSNYQLTAIYLLPPLITALIPGAIVWMVIDKSAGKKILSDFLFSYSSLFGQFFIYSLLIGAINFSRQLNRTVASQFEALSYIRRELASGISESKTKLIEQVNEILGNSKANFEASTSEEISSGFQEIIDGAVRPLSHEIEAEATTQTRFDTEVERAKQKARKVSLKEQIKRKVPLTLAVNPLISVVLYLNFVATSMVFLFGYQSLWQLFTPFIVLSYLLYLVFEKLAVNRLYNIFKVIILGGLLSIFQSLVFAFLSARNVDYDQGQLGALSFTIFLITAGSVIYGILIHNIVENSKNAELFNLELAKESKSVRQQLWHLHKRVARELHGGLQSKLQIAALKGENVDLDKLFADFTSAISTPEIDRQTELLSESLDNLIDFWDGVCKITSNISRDTLEAIEKNPILSEYLLEIIREAINNAIKHAKSDQIEISIDMKDDLIELAVINNVHKSSSISNSNQSLGTKIFKELAESWKLEIGDKQSKFVATLSLNS